MSHSSLSKAKEAKNDEFYTQIGDVEKEMRHYREHFKGKSILCNCDDPYESNFFKYFALNFNHLGLRELMATCYSPSPISHVQITLDMVETGLIPEDKRKTKTPYMIRITEVTDANGDGATDLGDVEHLLKNEANTLTLLDGNGDFRSPECVKMLDEADIVVTNPPFSLFREYIALLLDHEKKFIIIGNQNAITYKQVFPLLMGNKVWLGYNNGNMEFTVPEYYEPRDTRFWIDEHGQKWRSLGNVCWFTNLDIAKRHEDLVLYREYDSAKYPRYDECDAIEVSKIEDIPYDYAGTMGVPITFMNRFNPDQFEIVGNLGSYAPDGYSLSGSIHVKGRKIFKRIAIRNKHPREAMRCR